MTDMPQAHATVRRVVLSGKVFKLMYGKVSDSANRARTSIGQNDGGISGGLVQE